jgi:hypothetical protein
MESNRTEERQQAHALIDRLTDEQLEAVRNLLEVMVEPLARSLAAAAVEDGEITETTAAAIDRARASLQRGEGIAHDDILKEFCLKQ